MVLGVFRAALERSEQRLSLSGPFSLTHGVPEAARASTTKALIKLSPWWRGYSVCPRVEHEHPEVLDMWKPGYAEVIRSSACFQALRYRRVQSFVFWVGGQGLGRRESFTKTWRTIKQGEAQKTDVRCGGLSH